MTAEVTPGVADMGLNFLLSRGVAPEDASPSMFL